MTQAAYTVHDTPRVKARIEDDLETVVDTVKEGDPHLESLVLTGGFARGEGAVMDGQPQNDYDLVAARGLGRARTSYQAMTDTLEDQLGLHIDLAPVHAWRLRFVSPSIFWYETAKRGRVLHGEDLLSRIPVKDPEDLDPTEGLRLLTNRAAGLLLATRDPGPHEHRIQASKGLLAALDAHLLAHGSFPPSQTERWERYQAMKGRSQAPPQLEKIEDWLAWAYGFKTDPENQAPRDPETAWQAAARAILDALPPALEHAQLASLEAYQHRDGLADHAHYALHAASMPHAPTLLRNPTGTVRHATLKILGASKDGSVDPQTARRILGPLQAPDEHPLATLDKLRSATLQ